jgi:UDP-N-acetylmuramoylalanine--D-glutamate ligase
LAGEILKEAGFPTLVAGNIGVPVIGLIGESTDKTWSVLEVSSFQLESTEQFHPAIAVILNITPDHLDRHGTFENYALAKERIFAAQDSTDCLVLNADNSRAAQAALRTRGKVHWFSIVGTGRQCSVPFVAGRAGGADHAAREDSAQGRA